MLHRKLHSRRGLTLVEMVAVMLCAALVALGASAMVLTATRVAREASLSAENQQLVRIIRRGLDGLSEHIRYYVPDGDGWTLQDATPTELLRYDSGDKTLSAGGTVLMKAVTATVDEGADLDNQLLNLTLSSDGHSYQLVIFCRALNRDPLPTPEPEPAPGEGGAKAAVSYAASEPRRLDFLATLAGELGSDGRIRGTETYYSEWYLGGTYALNPDWNEATPWCACYLSWALAEQPEDAMSEVPCFAHVDAGAEWFRTRALWTDASEAAPGDLVFFDWDGDGTPDHVGAVLDTDAERLTTLEGNSNGQVECRSWPADSPFIQGVGVLPWKG
ncbi:MAG: CHAP domain-containing protein [Oscillospiraceae bacterium]|nr:CHAP domain-containing protein [Oscillospiraceae bacterium]